MIALQSDHLIFQLTNGESIPCSVEMISIEIAGNSEGMLDAEMLRHASASVFHYFKVELERETVTVGEFAQALEKVLHGLGLTLFADQSAPETAQRESDLGMLASESAENLELFFFPRLRTELRSHLSHAPRVLRFRACAAAPSNSPGPGAGAHAAKRCPSRLWITSATASTPRPSRTNARWWWNKISDTNCTNSQE